MAKQRQRLAAALSLIALASAAWLKPAAASDLITQFEESQALGNRLNGKIEKQFFAAPALGKNQTRRVYVYTPPGYTGVGSRAYPVLILLHGTPGDPVEWLYRGSAHKNIDALIKSGKVPPFIAVFPDGHGPFTKYGSEWADAVSGKSNMETAVSRDLIAWLRQNYRVPTNPAFWAIGGLSAGGYGAANLMTRHPDTFRGALVLSGDFDVSDDWGDAEAVFGSDPRVRIANSPLRSIHKLAPDARSKLFFYIAVGQDDDTDLVAQNEAFARLCRSLNIPVVLDDERGGHQWGFWSSHLKSGILAWARHLGGTK